MGITITATNSKYEFDMRYFGFFKLRREIALVLNEEFGRNYADLARCNTQEEYAANDKITSRIIQKNHNEAYMNASLSARDNVNRCICYDLWHKPHR